MPANSRWDLIRRLRVNIVYIVSILRTLQHGKQTYLYMTQSVLSNIIRPWGIKHFHRSFQNYCLLWSILLNIQASLLTKCSLNKIRFSILKANCFLCYQQRKIKLKYILYIWGVKLNYIYMNFSFFLIEGNCVANINTNILIFCWTELVLSLITVRNA